MHETQLGIALHLRDLAQRGMAYNISEPISLTTTVKYQRFNQCFAKQLHGFDVGRQVVSQVPRLILFHRALGRQRLLSLLHWAAYLVKLGGSNDGIRHC